MVDRSQLSNAIMEEKKPNSIGFFLLSKREKTLYFLIDLKLNCILRVKAELKFEKYTVGFYSFKTTHTSSRCFLAKKSQSFAIKKNSLIIL